MADPLEKQKLNRDFGDIDYLNLLNSRRDIFEIEGNKSLYRIGEFALVFGICFGIGLWMALRAIIPAQLLLAPDENHGGFENQNDEINPPLREKGVQFVLKTNKAIPKKHSINGASALSLQKKKAYRKSSQRLNPSRTGATRTGVMRVRQPMPSVTTSGSRSANQKAVQNPIEETSLLQRGDALKKHRDYTGALEAYQRVLAQSPENSGALAGKGDLFSYTGEFDSAIAYYREALAVNSRNPAIHNGLGSALYYQSQRTLTPDFAKSRHIQDPARYLENQYDSAIAEYTEAISLDSSYVEALTNRGVLRDLENDHAAAIKDYTLAIRINPADATAYSKRASIYASLGRFDEAVADYSAAINLDSSTYEFDPTLHFANAYFGRGEAYYKLGKLDKAIADFDSALVLSPGHSLAYLRKGAAFAGEEHYDSAISAYTKAISLLTPDEYHGSRMLAYLLRGNAWKALGQYDTAIADYRRAMTASDQASKACWRIAECYCFKQDTLNALAWLKKGRSLKFVEIVKWRDDRELSMLWNLPEFNELTRE